MKKLITLLFCVQMVVSAMAAAWTGSIASGFSGGDGTSTTPYLIGTGDELAYLAQQVNVSNAYPAATSVATLKYFKLTADIDLGSMPWTPIGNATYKFGGVFDGNNHTISNLSISVSSTLTANYYAGVFGWVYGGTSAAYSAIIKNITLSSGSVIITSGTTTYPCFTGGIVGRSDNANISNCKNAATVSGYSGVGGIAGSAYVNTASVPCIVENCSNSGSISGNGAGNNVGGIVGSITAASTAGAVTSYVRYCYNTGSVGVGTRGGGILGAGFNQMTIQECFNKGAITVSNSSNGTGAGGIVGRGQSASVSSYYFNVLNCYNTGAVKCNTASSLNGGILGYAAAGYYQAITNCYNIGAVTGTGTGAVNDGIAGQKITGSAVTNCYYLNTLSATNTVSGATSTPATTMQTSTFVSITSNSNTSVNGNQNPAVWGQSASYNNSYPYLLWQVLNTPTINAATSITTGGFTASWSAVNFAVSYDIKVYDSNSAQVGTTTNVTSANLSTAITGLAANTSYTYTVTAKGDGTNTFNSAESAAQSFTTLPAPPTVTTQAASAITTTTATGKGNITSLGVPNPTQYGHCWKTSAGATVSDTKTTLGAASATGALTSALTGLASSTTYYVKAYATNTAGTVYGDEVSFSTITAATDYFRSKATGNWSDASTWESSFDNTNWVSATDVPSSSATSVNIITGHTVTITANTTTSNLSINSGGTVIVNAGMQFTISTSLSNSGALNLLSTSADGTATILTPATIGGSGGTTSVQQYLTTGRNWYISSPLSGANSSVFNAAAASNINKLYWYDETNGSSATLNWPQITDNSTSLSVTKGYVANVDTTLVVSTKGVTFSGGSLNTGDITTGSNGVPALSYSSSQAKSGFNLVGNPYCSYLNWNTVTKTNLASNTMWYRTKVSGTYYFYTYNSVDGAAGIGISVPADVTNLIPPMQAFWVRAAGSGASLTYHNTDRANKDKTNNLLRTKAQINSAMQIVRLQVSNGVNSDETVLYTYPDASNQYDSYDSPKMTNANAAIPEIYTTVSNENLVINGMNAIPYDTEIPLGFTTGQAGSNFSIKASQLANFDSGTQLILKDYLDPNNPVITDLSDGSSYTFSSAITTNNTSRFALIFKAPSVATAINPESNSNVWISTRNGEIMINGIIGSGARLEVFNAIGQKVISRNLTKTNVQQNNTLVAGAYLVKVTNEGKTVIKKIIID